MINPPRAISGALSHEEQVEYARHRKRVEQVRSAVDTQPPRFRPRDGKRVMMQNEIRQRIQAENVKLVNRILIANTPSISKQAQKLHEKRHHEKGAVMVRNMQMQRLYKQDSIAHENEILLRRLIHQKPVYSSSEFARHEAEAARMRRNFSLFERYEWRMKNKLMRSQGLVPEKMKSNQVHGVSLSMVPPPSKRYLEEIPPLAEHLPSIVAARKQQKNMIHPTDEPGGPKAKIWEDQSSNYSGATHEALHDQRDTRVNSDFKGGDGSMKSTSSSFKLVPASLNKALQKSQTLADAIDRTLEELIPERPKDDEGIFYWVKHNLYRRLKKDPKRFRALLQKYPNGIDEYSIHKILTKVGLQVSRYESIVFLERVAKDHEKLTCEKLERYLYECAAESSMDAVRRCTQLM